MGDLACEEEKAGPRCASEVVAAAAAAAAFVDNISAAGEEGRRREGSTGGGGRLGFDGGMLALVAISTASSSTDSRRLWPTKDDDDDDAKGVVGTKSAKGNWAPLRLPGVALKTEYSSANRGVRPLVSAKDPWGGFGVSKIGLGKAPDVGVCFGVGGG